WFVLGLVPVLCSSRVCVLVVLWSMTCRCRRPGARRWSSDRHLWRHSCCRTFPLRLFSSLLRLKAHPLHAGAQLIAKSNHGFLATHEGVDVGGERLGKEVQHARPPVRTLLMPVNLCPAGDGVCQ